MTRTVEEAVLRLVAVDVVGSVLALGTHLNLVQRNFEPTLAQIGDTVAIESWKDVRNRDWRVSLRYAATASFTVPDIIKVLAVPDLLNIYMEPATKALASAMDATIAQEIANAATIAEKALLTSARPYQVLVACPSKYSQFRGEVGVLEYRSPAEAGLRTLAPGPVLRKKFSAGMVPILRSDSARLTTEAGGISSAQLFSANQVAMEMRRLPQPLPGTGTIAEAAELGNFGLRISSRCDPSSLTRTYVIDCLYGLLTAPGAAAVVEEFA